MEKKRKQQSFLQGAFILTTATMIVKIIGAIFKIPLGNLLGGTGMGYFSSAYDLYLPFYSLAMAGLPVAISRLVAERVAEKRFADVNRTLRVAQRVFLVTGLTGTVILALVTYPYILFTGNSGALYSMMTVIPALLFCCVMSSYRGFYEGLRNMYPTAVSSIIEALGKLILGLGFAYGIILKARAVYAATGLVFGKTITFDNTQDALTEAITNAAAPYAAAGAILGITIGSALGAVFLIIYHRIVGSRITKEEIQLSPPARSNRQILRTILIIAVPVVIGSLVTNFSSLIDLLTVQRRLATAVQNSPDTFLTMYAGLLPNTIDSTSSLEDLVSTIPNYLYGCYKGFAYSVYNLTPSLTSVLGVSALPVLATVWVEKKKDAIKDNIEFMVKITALAAMPAGAGLTALSGQILYLLYSGKAKEVAVTTPILTILGVATICTGMASPVTSMLQAIGKQNIPARNIAIGTVLKFTINLILVGIPSINIIGAAIGTLICYLFYFSANFYALVKHSGVHISYGNTLLKPFFSAVLCGGTAYLSYKLIYNIITIKNISALIAIFLAVAVYAAALWLTKCITKEDLKWIKRRAK